MEYTNQTDSIFTTLLRSAINDTQTKIRSITSPIEYLIETSIFYELAIIQINASLKLVKQQPEHQIPEIKDLINIKNLLQDRLRNIKHTIITKDEALMQNLGDQSKSEQNIMMEQMKSDMDMLKERFDQVDRIVFRSLDQHWRWLIEKETILITMKGYIHDQSLEYLKKDAIITRLMEEQHQSTLQTMAMEEHYMILLNDCYKDFQDYDDNESVNTRLNDEVFQVVVVEVMKDLGIKYDLELQRIQNEICIVLDEKLCTNLSRLDEIKQRVDSLSRLAVSIRKDELVYKKAFARRCENLLLAETEVGKPHTSCRVARLTDNNETITKATVDCARKRAGKKRRLHCISRKAHGQRHVTSLGNLVKRLSEVQKETPQPSLPKWNIRGAIEDKVDLLGDQVEALQDLLIKIYFILEQSSSVLSHNFQVMDILKTIKTELKFL
ncbi:hypothetical protein QVD17_28879 [Tagetes erecta]|uniref:Uncharacterized protein n=1 Tax=Tagetes erecta TaxID=13708 RepID=A0AAD8KE39_TARER|nr:hypothetical protein QVD17_28879 [Tagetes erecta]